MTDILDLLSPSLATDDDILRLLLHDYQIPFGFPGHEEVSQLIAGRNDGDDLELKTAMDGGDSIKAMKIKENEWRIFYCVKDVDMLLADNY